MADPLATMNQRQIDSLSRVKAQEIALKYGIPASLKVNYFFLFFSFVILNFLQTERIIEKIRELKRRSELENKEEAAKMMEEDISYLTYAANFK